MYIKKNTRAVVCESERCVKVKNIQEVRENFFYELNINY